MPAIHYHPRIDTRHLSRERFMDSHTLEHLIAQGESETVELKTSTGQRTEAFKTICAMLNGGIGGCVVFGVSNDGRVVGQMVTTSTREDLAHEARRLEPLIDLAIREIPMVRDRSVLVVDVPTSTGFHLYAGTAYQRIGPSTSVMPLERQMARMAEASHATHRWELLTAPGYSIDDLDTDEIVRTVDEGVRRRLLQDPGSRDPASLLMRLDLLKDGRPTNAAVVLFAKPDRVMPHFPQCLLRMARFRGETKREFEDNRQVFGNAFELYARGQQFWIDHIPLAGRVVPGQLERIDEPLYPTEALREALVNAICHRDYREWGGSLEIAIYDDRLEIGNPGTLHFGLTAEDLMQEHPSKPWNPHIANAFYRRGIIEHWGRGTNRIVELTTAAGLPEPEFIVTSADFRVRFWNGRMHKSAPRPPLSQLQEELLDVLRSIGPASRQQIHAELATEAASRTVQENLQALRAAGYVEMTGNARSIRWSAWKKAQEQQ